MTTTIVSTTSNVETKVSVVLRYLSKHLKMAHNYRLVDKVHSLVNQTIIPFVLTGNMNTPSKRMLIIMQFTINKLKKFVLQY